MPTFVPRAAHPHAFGQGGTVSNMESAVLVLGVIVVTSPGCSRPQSPGTELRE